MTQRALAWRQFAVTLALLGLFFLFPSWIPGDWARPLVIAIQVLAFAVGVGFLSRYWGR